MNPLCWLVGHKPGARTMDTAFHEYSRCRRCGVPLERNENGTWREAEARERGDGA